MPILAGIAPVSITDDTGSSTVLIHACAGPAGTAAPFVALRRTLETTSELHSLLSTGFLPKPGDIHSIDLVLLFVSLEDCIQNQTTVSYTKRLLFYF